MSVVCESVSGSEQVSNNRFVCLFHIYLFTRMRDGIYQKASPTLSLKNQTPLSTLSKNTVNLLSLYLTYSVALFTFTLVRQKKKNKHIAVIEKSQFCSCPLANFTKAAQGKTKSCLFSLVSVGQNTEHTAEVTGLRRVKRNLNQEKLE